MHRTLQAARRGIFATVCAAMMLTQSACAPVSRGDFCDIYAPVYTVAEDSLETKSASDANNAVWWEICAP